MKKTELKFIQVNLHKAKQGQIEIAAKLRKLNKSREAFITMIQEPMTDKSRAIYSNQNPAKYLRKDPTLELEYT